MLKSFKYEFLEELEYDAHGDRSIAEYLEIKAPSNNIMSYVTMIECLYRKAASEGALKLRASMSDDQLKQIENNLIVEKKGEQTNEDHLEESLEIVNMMLGQADSKEMNSVYNALDMILKDSAKIDGATPFGGALFKKMTPLDTKYILGEYINNFFIVSPKNSKE